LNILLEDVGYAMQGRMIVYYYIPMLTIARNGLSYDEIDTTTMTNFVGIGQNCISTYLDHDESNRAVD
jgi:hypothetical protein